MIEIESVKIKIGKKVVEVTKEDADLAKLLESIGVKSPMLVPYYPVPYYPYYPYYPRYPSVWTLPLDTETTDNITTTDAADFSPHYITLSGG